MNVTDIRPFIPSKDFEVSTAFYEEIGFVPEYVTEDLTLFNSGDCYFFLQRFFDEGLARNFMLQVCVTDIEDTYQRCSCSQHKTKITPVQQERWGKVFYLWGPVGELLHITQLNGE